MPHSIVKFSPLEVTMVLSDAGQGTAVVGDPTVRPGEVVEDAPVLVDALLGATQSGSW